jgi:hypothetical protein
MLARELELRQRDRCQVAAEVHRLHGERLRMSAELSEVYRSRSWRVTEPLRRLSRLVRVIS